MLDVIKFSEELSIYTAKINGINNEQLCKDLLLNCDVNRKTSKMVEGPGIQSSIIITTENIRKLEIILVEKLKYLLNLKTDTILYKDYWVFISQSDNNKSNYHDHVSGPNLKQSIETPQWTFVYYASFPNNLEENEGLLFFKTKSGEEFSIMPEEGELIMFPADVLHRPGLNNKSTKDRIVFAGNYAVLDINKKYSKHQKTLL